VNERKALEECLCKINSRGAVNTSERKMRQDNYYLGTKFIDHCKMINYTFPYVFYKKFPMSTKVKL